MSQAHRPTWNPTQGRETKAGSQQIAKLSLAAHKKLKFRQPGQGTSSENQRRDLRAELAQAERAAQDKKRKAAGLPPLPPLPSALRIEAANGEAQPSGQPEDADEDEEARKRRKVLEEALEQDRDDSSDEDEEGVRRDKGKGKAADAGANGNSVSAGEPDNDDDDEDDDDDDDSDDDEDDTAALMAELAKIKQERAEEKARLDAEKASSEAIDRDFEIATGNPLLNLQAALGQSPGTPSSTAASSAPSSFAVKRRWDDDLIFKNQAAGISEKGKKGEFVNDLLRSEFHKKFMQKFIK